MCTRSYAYIVPELMRQSERGERPHLLPGRRVIRYIGANGCSQSCEFIFTKATSTACKLYWVRKRW